LSFSRKQESIINNFLQGEEMKNLRILVVIVGVMAVVNFASADTIRGINVDFVTIGNAGNAADTGGTVGCGAVGYNYRIGKYEVTNAQWDSFTAAAGVPTGNPSSAYDQSAWFTGAQQPANGVSWYEAAQFCNYLTSGNKSLGAYRLGTDGSIAVDRASAVSAYGTAYVIPTQDEWYKAAYFKPNGSGYSTYANGTDIAPSTSNYCYGYPIHLSPWNIGSGTMEQNGTFDMMGNVWEWNETLFNSSDRGILGGSYWSVIDALPSSYWHNDPADSENNSVGFRIVEIPEPATILLLTLGGLLLRKSRS
jgi:formylglycine-generating enzyme